MILALLADHLDQLDRRSPRSVIPWACPVPYFGDVFSAVAATVGINPSNREFMDTAGRELVEAERRLPTLSSLGLRSWADADSRHLQHVVSSCKSYFHRQPYDRWFRVLERVLSPSGSSYYGHSPSACHIDLFAFSTYCKWNALPTVERRELLEDASEALALLLRWISAQILILNGRAVVDAFETATRRSLMSMRQYTWDLPRHSRPVPGICYMGQINKLAGIPLDRTVTVVGFNHNIQSSFGVTSHVIHEIGSWLAPIILGQR